MKGLMDSHRVISNLSRSSANSTNSMKTDERHGGFSSCRHQSPFVLHRPQEDERGRFHSSHVVGILLSFSIGRTKRDEDSSILFTSSAFFFCSSPTARKRKRTDPFFSCLRHSAFVLHRPHEDERERMHSVHVVGIPLSFSIGRTKIDENVFRIPQRRMKNRRPFSSWNVRRVRRRPVGTRPPDHVYQQIPPVPIRNEEGTNKMRWILSVSSPVCCILRRIP